MLNELLNVICPCYIIEVCLDNLHINIMFYDYGSRFQGKAVSGVKK
jgi:hypothetical protein